MVVSLAKAQQVYSEEDVVTGQRTTAHLARMSPYEPLYIYECFLHRNNRRGGEFRANVGMHCGSRLRPPFRVRLTLAAQARYDPSSAAMLL